MLNWWLGRPTEGSSAQDSTNAEIDAPETPAPIFAARALKSAIFGTPAPPEDGTVHEVKTDQDSMPNKGNSITQLNHVSPTKPAGILLTPGTAASRRKTVTFGNEVASKEKAECEQAGTERDLPDHYTRRIPNSWTNGIGPVSRANRKTPLTRTLENARATKSGEVQSGKRRSSSESQTNFDQGLHKTSKLSSPLKLRHGTSSEPQTNQELMQELIIREDSDMDMTVDINEPNSQSGRYWKSELENYHEEAQVEMRKLLRYKQLAKSYAKKKDQENIDLAEKLKLEQKKIVNMEVEISSLSARIASAGLLEADGDAPEMIKDLAKQTALAEQYKTQVEELKAALTIGANYENKPLVSGPISQGGLPQEEQHNELDPLKEKSRQPQRSFSAMEKENQKLQQENTRLTQELLHSNLRFEKHIEECEQRRQSLDDQKQKKESALQNLRNDYDTLKEQAKGQRRDAEQLLKKRHDQVVQLKREMSSIRGAATTAKDFQNALQNKTAEHDRMVADYEIQIAELKKDVIMGAHGVLDMHESLQKTQEQLSGSPISFFGPSVESPQPKGSQIPIINRPISRPLKGVAPARQPYSETIANLTPLPPSQIALSEIINNASPNSLPPPRSGPVQFTPIVQRVANVSVETTSAHLPLIEPRAQNASTREIHDRNCRPSPRPSMFNIGSSPPKSVKAHPKADEGSRQRANQGKAEVRCNKTVGPGRLSNPDDSRARRTLPPERAAAAKARLKQKNADKKRAMLALNDKENAKI